jgi:hypothetical protein
LIIYATIFARIVAYTRRVVMAIGKEELLQGEHLTGRQQDEANDLDDTVKAELKRGYSGGSVRINLPKRPGSKALEEVEKRYREMGWSVRSGSDPGEFNDDYWIELS